MKLSKPSLLAAALAAVALVPALADEGHAGPGRRHGEREAAHAIAHRHVHGVHRVVVGEPLPHGPVFTLPHHVRPTLPPPAGGYRYRW